MAMRRRLSGSLPRFQAAWMPMDTSTTSASARYGKVRVNQPGPTEIDCMPSASLTSGASVPMNTTSAASTSAMLLYSRKASRETPSKPAGDFSNGARQLYSVSAPPIMSTRNARMNSPRSGSAANECTETSTPERTRKVPSRLSENARMASSSVQLLNNPRFSVTASEWISAVPTSHGMNDAFSTGSQNQQP